MRVAWRCSSWLICSSAPFGGFAVSYLQEMAEDSDCVARPWLFWLIGGKIPSFIAVTCAALIGWLLVPTGNLVVFLTSSPLLFPQDSVVTMSTMKFWCGLAR